MNEKLMQSFNVTKRRKSKNYLKIKNIEMETLIEPKKTNKKENTLSPELLKKINAYWRAANYLSVGQLCLHQNPLLREPLKLEHIKKMLLGHWGISWIV